MKTKPPITQAIDTLIAAHIAPFLKSQGFRRKGQRFARDTGEAIEVLEFDRWKYNEGNSGKFGVTLGVFHPAVSRMVDEARPGWGEPADARFPPVQDCLLNECLMPPEDQREHAQYWPIDADNPIEEVAGRLLPALETAALPWLSANTLLQGTLPRLSELSRKNVWLASVHLLCAAAILRRPDLADEALAAVLAPGPSSHFPESERKAFRDIANGEWRSLA